LVDLLKHPVCTGEVRVGVLKELGRRTGPPPPSAKAIFVGVVAALPQSALGAAALAVHSDALYPGGREPFADLWEAVDWLNESQPELDLASPARRVSQ
jgi:hypothetical protein